MKWFNIFLVIFSISSLSRAQDITLFDYPLLLGDWYWFSPDGEETTYKAISIHFNSDYHFKVKLLNNQGQVDSAVGTYDLNEDTMIFYDSTGTAQQHNYHLNHHQLLLKGALFTKILQHKLSGLWYSDDITGDDVDNDIVEFALQLRPDFLFSVEISDKAGQSIVHRGVYYLEDDHLVLVYKNGQQDSRFKLEADTLILSNQQFGMEAVLKRQ